MGSLGPECTPKCSSTQHAEAIVSVVTRGSESQIKAFLTTFCWNATTLRDNFGRNVLHVAASCGKKGLLDWLAEKKGTDLHVKDKESGWTPLHRSMFYGHIDCAMSLLKHGSDLFIPDKEGLSALDLVMKDRPAHITFSSNDLTELYTWGDNINFTLGHGGHQSKHHPELVDLFPRTGVYIKQVVLCEFHSVFLSQKGHIYTCGHGQGGRLGHGNEQTYLAPKLVEGLTGHLCSQVAAAKDHTVVLTEDGAVFTFGLNTFHQLGILPSPSNCNVPKQVIAKNLKGRTVIGVAAANFHTVLWTKEAVYTMGLNGGQLGYLLDPNGEKCVTSLRQVSALHHKDITVSLVAASDGATVCATEKGDLYLLSDYQCKKLASKQLNLKKVLVSGGLLEHKSDPQHLKENGGERVCILALDQAGRVFCWRSQSSSLKQCRWVYGRQVFMSDIALNKNGFVFVTQDGEGFTGKWSRETKQMTEKKEVIPILLNTGFNSFGHCDVNSVYERIHLEKLSYIHRAVSVTTDPNGFNFAVLQSDPKTNLFEIPTVSQSTFADDFHTFFSEMDEMDSIHDVTFQLDTRIFPVHKYILALRSDFFRKLFLSEESSQQNTYGYQKTEDAVGCDLFVMEKVNPELFTYLLQYIYTDSCDLLTPGYKPKILHKEKTVDHQDSLISDLQKMTFLNDIKGKSAYEVYRSNQVQANKEKQKGNQKPAKKGKLVIEEGNPVKMMQTLAKKFGLDNLNDRLDGVRYENGKIKVVNKKNGDKPKLIQDECSFLCDITLKSKDGKEFQCHKCVLCARLEYFHSMLSSTWIEATCSAALEMPIHSDILQVILDYIYTDDAVFVKELENVEFICNVLVVADQLLINRLKEICEVAIAEKLTLKNAAELLEFAAMYNAEQLKVSCLQFIGLNMAALLEARTLDVLSDDVLKDLSVAYKNMIPAMERRIITPYLDGPDIGFLDSDAAENFIFPKEDDVVDQTSQEALLKKAKSKVKKKSRKRSDSSAGYTISDLIQTPPSAGLLNLNKANSVESLHDFQTSDSEGSCAGAASPRELQSPDFLTRLQHEKTEVKVCVSPSHNAIYGVERKLSNQTSATKPSIPVSIPGTQKASPNSTSWIASSFSPASPPAVDLRTIMEIEENMQKRGTAPKTNTGGSKAALHGSKLSQKQRKMIAISAKENSVVVNSPEKTPITLSSTSTSASKPVKTWGAATPSALKSSFRQLLFDEQKSTISSPHVPSAVRKIDFTGVEELPTPKPLRQLKSSPNPDGHHTPEVALSESPNPWLLASVASPSPTTPVTFAAIVEEEIQQEAALVWSREKPLALIQIEECAIQDLLIHYRAFGNPDEFVMVERTSKGPIARPMWNKH